MIMIIHSSDSELDGSAAAAEWDDWCPRDPEGEKPVRWDFPAEPDYGRHIPPSVKPYLRWGNNVRTRVEACLANTPRSHGGHRIEFNLAPPGDSDPQSWINYVLDCGLSAVPDNDVCFKIGITYWPDQRFKMHDYRNLELMIVALISENCDWTAAQECAAIARYRVLDREGRVVNPSGDFRCLNKAPGGESHDHGYSPHFLYVVFGRRAQFSSNVLFQGNRKKSL